MTYLTIYLIFMFRIGRGGDKPSTAKRCKDPDIRRMMEQLWKDELDFYQKSGGYMICGGSEYVKSFGAIESGWIWYADEGKPTKESLELFNGKVHPMVDGYEWYRGIMIPTKKGRMFIYAPWLAPWMRVPSETRPHEVYTDGEVEPEEIKQILNTYVQRIHTRMDRLLRRQQEERALKGFEHLAGSDTLFQE